MSGPATLMREIHRLRRFTRDLQDQIDRLPRQAKAHQARIARQEELLKEAQEAVKKLKVAGHEKEVSLKTAHGQIAKYQKQLNEAASKKEYDALQAEIAAARATCQQLEDDILAGMAEGEERAAQVPELEKAVRQAKADLEAFERDSGARQAALTEERDRVLKQLAEVEATIPPDAREIYERLTRGRGEDALAAVVGRTCSACYTEITAQGSNELLAEKFVQCKSCGRILYLPGQ